MLKNLLTTYDFKSAGTPSGVWGSVSNPPGRLVGLRYLLSGNVFYQFLGCTVFEYYFVFLVQ